MATDTDTAADTAAEAAAAEAAEAAEAAAVEVAAGAAAAAACRGEVATPTARLERFPTPLTDAGHHGAALTRFEPANGVLFAALPRRCAR